MNRTHHAAGNLIAGTATRYVVLAVNIAVGIVLMPFTVHHLGQSDYGLWMLVASMTAYFQLLDLGYGNGVVRHLVEADRRGSVDEMNCIASTCMRHAEIQHGSGRYTHTHSSQAHTRLRKSRKRLAWIRDNKGAGHATPRR